MASADIQKQLEYYFSDSNLKRDLFMRKTITADEADRAVKIETLLTFNNLKKLTTKKEDIEAAVKASNELKLVGDGAKVARATALPESVPLLGAPVLLNGKKFEKKEDLVKELRDVLHQTTEEKELDEDFVKLLTDFLAYHPKAPEKIGCGIASFHVGKNPAHDNTKCFCFKRTDGTSEDFSYWKIVENIWPTKKESKKKNKGEAKEGTRRSERIASQSGEEEKKKEKEVEFTKGVLLNVKNIGDEASREDLKEQFEGCGKISYVDMQRGDKEAVVRFDSPEDCTKAVEQCKGKEVKGGKIELSVLEGEAEKEYWEKVHKAQAEKKSGNKRKSFGGGRGGGRGGRGGFKKQRR